MATDYAVPLRMILEERIRSLKRIIEYEHNASSVPSELESKEGDDIQNKIRLSNINTNPLVKADRVLSAFQIPGDLRLEMPVEGRPKNSEDFKFPSGYLDSPDLSVT
jgi:SPX domain protein involved in polyphosphate accumulation